MYGTMMNIPLSIPSLMEFAAQTYPDQTIVTQTVKGSMHRYTYSDAMKRIRKVANVLRDRGVSRGDRVATLAWNTYRHFELYYAVSGVGAICHTINPRLSLDQISYIINDAEDALIFFDITFAPIIAALKAKIPSVKTFICLAEEEHLPEVAGVNIESYEDFLQSGADDFIWPELDETTSAALCYTSGTTGNPKGVIYTHRSTLLHAMGCAQPNIFGISSADTVLPVVPMFHVNAWGLPYIAPMCGASLVFTGPALDGESICRLINDEKVTFTAGVPTIWHGLLNFLETSGKRLDSLRNIACGGAAAPESMITAFEKDYGIDFIHGWGMTETSPIAAISLIKPDMEGFTLDQKIEKKAMQGPPLFGIDARIIDPAGAELPRNGKASGELVVRGNWIANGYYRQKNSPTEDYQGWFPTGDIATIDANGFIQITDRLKDVIKSGGEWISSIELENTAIEHPQVAQVAVIGLADPKWGERPLMVIVPASETYPTIADIRMFLSVRLEKWQMPEEIIFVEDLPIGGTGKILKRKLRENFTSWTDVKNHQTESKIP